MSDPNNIPAPLSDAQLAELRGLVYLGNLVLGNASLGFIFSEAAQLVRAVLGADRAEIYKLIEGHLLLVGGAGWKPGVVGEAQAATGVSSHPGYALQIRDAVAAEDLTTETRFTPSKLLMDEGLVSGVAIPIESSDERSWGVLAAHSTARRKYTGAEVDFMRALSILLSQAVERRSIEVELRIRLIQQSAIADLGRRVLTNDVATETFERACELIIEGLGVEFASYLELDAEGKTLTWCAGPQWATATDAAVTATIPQGRHTVAIAEPLMVNDYEHETRFDASYLRGLGVRSGISVPVFGTKRKYGVLTAHTRIDKRFDAADVHFMNSLANILAEAMERQRAHHALEESELKFRGVVEGASEIIFSVAADGTITSLNPAFEFVTGWKVEQWVGRHFKDLIDPAQLDEMLAVFRSILTEPRHLKLEARMIGADGRKLILDASASPKIVDGVVKEVYGFARDVTEHHRLESERRRIEGKLEQASRLAGLGRLAATVAHEFNNVLMGISPFADLLRRESLSERGTTAVDQIARSVKRGKRITEDILRFTRPAEPTLAPMDLRPWLNRVSAEAQSLIGPKYTIEVECDSDVRIHADQGQLHQTLLNLILNARDAMPNGGRIGIKVKREPRKASFPFGVVDSPERFAHLIVEDNGIGMSPDILDHIFEPLFTTKKNGTGLGLPVARHVIVRHGGEIFVESAPGAGTKFHLFIPLAAGSTAQADHGSTDAREQRRFKRILLVEDERAVSAGLSALLESEGIRVDVVENGRDVMNAISSGRPDAVVLDIGLPDVDGTIVYEQIAEVHPQLPVVFSSGHADQAKLEPHLAKANVALLRKPYELEALLATLESVVG